MKQLKALDIQFYTDIYSTISDVIYCVGVKPNRKQFENMNLFYVKKVNITERVKIGRLKPSNKKTLPRCSKMHLKHMDLSLKHAYTIKRLYICS